MALVFETALTTSDFEEVLQKELQTTSKFGADVKFEELGDGNGVITQVGLLKADWTPADPSLPSSFAVKVSAPKTNTKGNQIAELINKTMEDENNKSMIKYHNIEVSIYEKFKKHNIVLRMPKMYVCKERKNYEDTGYIILEHYEGIASGIHMNDNVSEETTDDIIEQLAKIHKANPCYSIDEQTAMRGKMFQDTFSFMFQPEMLKDLIRMTKDFGGERMASEAEEMEKVLKEMRQPEYLKFLDEISDSLQIPRILCHGDVWMCNMLWKREENSLNLLAIIDFQGAQFNCPVADLARLFTGCLSGKDRRANWEKHLKHWVELMQDTPYGCLLEEVKEAYYRFFPGCAFIVAGSIAAVGPMILEKQPDEEKRRLAHESLLEKQKALLEDIIHHHKRNMQIMMNKQ